MYEFLQQHHGEYKTGVYYMKYPSLPMKETGITFKYKFENVSGNYSRDIANLGYNFYTSSISTSYNLDWTIEAYVLLGSELWQIINIVKNNEDSQANSIKKKNRCTYILTLNKVNNAVGVSR